MDNTADREKQAPRRKPSLFILSGPSGVGKDAVLNRLKKSSLQIKYVVTMTTRPRRDREQDNVDYAFVTKERFQELIDNNGLLEHANVYGNLYGVPRADVEDALDRGEDVLVKVDVQGVDNIKKIRPDSITIFLRPSSMEELTKRLKQRKTESAEAQELRIKTASEEMKRMPEFDYIVFNRRGEIDTAVSEIQSIISSGQGRTHLS